MVSSMKIEMLKNNIEQWMANYFSQKNKDYNYKIYEAMNYSIEVGGKRIRPILLLLSYELFKADYETVLPMACALEMIHTYSLIHDDLPCMDNDDLRRGKPTNHKVFGEAVAVLAGDSLLNEAMSIMFNFCVGKDQEKLLACKNISEAAGAEGMIGGQLVDIMSEGIKISEDQLRYMHRKKTGALIKTAIKSGAIAAGADELALDILDVYGEKLGLAFQIKDDILDVIGDAKVLGKNVNSDIMNDKSTFVSLFGIDTCEAMCNDLTNECINLLKRLNKNTLALEELTMFLLKREF